MSKRQRQWKSQLQQIALTEFDLVRAICPDGVYLCLTPGNFALWSGVLFVRKGPYASAVLRFQLAFPQDYPETPPLIIIANDVFHPLVTPHTTYTYSTSTSTTNPVSSGDDDRLLPGGLNLRHRFPDWFKRNKSRNQHYDKSDNQHKNQRGDSLETAPELEGVKLSMPAHAPRLSQAIFQPPPKDEGTSVEDAYPTIVEVLQYLKDVFEDESLLDQVPVEAAGNPGAWHAWEAYRRRTKPIKQSSDGTRSHKSAPSKGTNVPGKNRAGGWNWDGVWSDRVKKAINNSLAESALYGGGEGDDIIHFLDLDEETSDALRAQFRSGEIGNS